MTKVVFSILLAIVISILPEMTTVSAIEPVNKYFPNQGTLDSTFKTPLSPSEIVAMYPMSAEEEAKIIQVIPQCPVNVDGTWYRAEEITLFNGQQLHFTTDKTGALYAFTDAKAMETFLEAEYGKIYDLPFNGSIQNLRFDQSELFKDWMYSGELMQLAPFIQLSNLASLGWDDYISSAKICSTAPVTLWEYSGFQGNSFTMPADSNHAALTFEGWNDRASSIS
ncbi:hypothetical protein ASJ33_06195 [Dehalococcoides mccartyi]|uniref:hypothetical protein n=1 Tax=Dehalococcoides mccartyi TaxID=61435 RepID=UPI0004E08F0E|nr:hypothetical protein [Dehalococcoides mccartyi]AII58191.1 hypothetical protein X792_05710 [Dehalococcoides mccartyi CG1]APH12770.1 hypothetical protein ASJ33_06195 [Dehalococcoides mccartyi]